MSRFHHSTNVYNVVCPCQDCDFGVQGEKKAVMRRIKLHMKLSHPDMKNNMTWVDEDTGGFQRIKNSEAMRINANKEKHNMDSVLKLKEQLNEGFWKK